MGGLVSADPATLAAQGWFLMDQDEATGQSQWALYDDQQGTLKIITLQDTAKLIARNRAIQAEKQNERWGDGQIMASVPEHIWDALFLDAERAGDMEWIAKKLADPDFADLRTFRSEF